MIILTPKLVERVIREEAARHRADFDDVLNISMKERARQARYAAMRRLLALTECTPNELARAWGCDQLTVRSAMAADAPPHPIYDATTIERLRWAHGEARTAQIVAGEDPKARNDQAAWARLCRRGAA